MNLKHIRETIKVVKRAFPDVRVEFLRQERHCLVQFTNDGVSVVEVFASSPRNYDAAVNLSTKHILKELKCKTPKATSPVPRTGGTPVPAMKSARAARNV